MADTDKKEEQPKIVVKRIKKVAGGHHGGAWKIAYADFVTAMMAFFLLMWLLGSTTKGDLKGIADYFATPLHVAMAGGSGAGGSNSILNGGGKDLTHKAGQVNRNDDDVKGPENLRLHKKEMERLEMEALQLLKSKIEAAIDANPKLSKYKSQMMLDITPDGLRIQVVDELNRPMFAKAKSDLEPYAKDILREIGRTLNGVANRITISGHTDALQFAGGERYYSNWELSADRANASRRELVVGGMDETKVLQVVGLSSDVLFDKNDPLNPINRRIAIIVMNKKAEGRVTNEGPYIETASPADANKAVSTAARKPGAN